jgi:hypothetical protein
MHLDPTTIILGLVSLFFAITFLQSGLDKVFQRSGNLSWFKSVFETTLIKPIVTPLFYWITIQELVIGGWMLVAAFSYLFLDCYCGLVTDWGFILCLALLIQLFTGQRIAKDYPGASGIIPYILVALIVQGLFSQCCCA